MSSAECIHGFEPGFCDVCFPKTPPERPRINRQTSATKRSSPTTAVKPSISTAQQRVYHVTHISNLRSIIDSGLTADAEPAVDVSSELTRELRRTAEVGVGKPVADLVPFYLAPDATRWVQLREGATDPAWSHAARTATPTDFVFLVSTLAALGDEAVLSDGDAAGTLTRFAVGDQLSRMLVRLYDSDGRADAEALAKGPVPWERIQLIGVANERVRDRVRALTSTRVAVYPPWFTG